MFSLKHKQCCSNQLASHPKISLMQRYGARLEPRLLSSRTLPVDFLQGLCCNQCIAAKIHSTNLLGLADTAALLLFYPLPLFLLPDKMHLNHSTLGVCHEER